MTRIALTLALLFAAGPLRADVSLEGVDVYGTKRLSAAEAEKRYGKEIQEYAAFKGRQTKGGEKLAADRLQRLEDRIRREQGFAWVRASWDEFYAEGVHKAFMIIDVVEPADKAARMAFRRPPSGSVRDPGGLLAEWGAYMTLGWSLFRSGQLSVNHDACISLFCEWGAQTPELRQYEEKFLGQAKEHKEELVRVMTSDRDPAKRATAVYLLSYLPDGNESGKLVADALSDPAPEVRGAALRVYADYAVHHQQLFLPLPKIQAALDDPTAEVRSKALAVVAGMASNPVHHRFLILKVAPQLLRFLGQRQPSAQDSAYAALGILSKEAFDRRDLVSWQRWLEKAQAEAAASPEPIQVNPE